MNGLQHLLRKQSLRTCRRAASAAQTSGHLFPRLNDGILCQQSQRIGGLLGGNVQRAHGDTHHRAAAESFLQGHAFFEAARRFARVEGTLPAPESSHAIKVAIDEALKCKETGEAKNIVFGLTGTGYFDMVAYQRFNDGEMSDYIPTDEELAESLKKLP